MINIPVNVYDQVHILADTLKASDEYVDYMNLKEKVYDDDTNRALLDEYKRLQYRMQMSLASGNRMDEDQMKRMQQISGLLQFNPDTAAYLLAEFRFQKLLADIYKILADTAGINLDLLTGQ